MTYTITKQFHFSASHIIDGLPEGHQCGRLHGHNYIVEVVLQSETLNQVGFVKDYGELSPIKQWIDQTLDHRHLNDVLGEMPTSAECLAAFIFGHWAEEFPHLIAVRISETPNTWAEIRIHGRSNPY